MATPEELLSVGVGSTITETKAVMAPLDDNGDGAINLQEFINHAT